MRNRFSETLTKLAEKDPSIILLVGDIGFNVFDSFIEKFPDRFIPRYSMVSFHQIPYADVYNRGKIQFNLMTSFISGEILESELHTNILEQLQPIS